MGQKLLGAHTRAAVQWHCKDRVGAHANESTRVGYTS